MRCGGNNADPACCAAHSCSACTPLLRVPALQKHTWTRGLTLRNFQDHSRQNELAVQELKDLSSGCCACAAPFCCCHGAG